MADAGRTPSIAAGGSAPEGAAISQRRDANSLSFFEMLFGGLATAIGCGAALYFWGKRGSFWEDEIIAITHANQPLPYFFIETLRNDIHPPFYFLQLDGWIALGANTDRWALANSLAWALLSLGMVFWAARVAHGRRAAWFATALFATFPGFVWSAGTLRMYAMIPALALLTYHANKRWFEAGARGWLLFAWLVETLLVLTHAIEFYFVAFIVLCVLLEVAAERRSLRATLLDRGMGSWWGAQGLVALVAFPVAASALLRGSDASAPASIWEWIATPGSLIVGWKVSSYVAARYVGLGVFILLAAASLSVRASRVRTLVIPIGALAVAILVSAAVKPMLKQPIFAANLLPFLALGAGAAVAEGTRWGKLAIIACIALLAIAAFPVAREQAQGEPFRPAAEYLREQVKPGDVVVIPNVSVFWGILRYAVDPNWGQPLDQMAEPNPQWRGVVAKINQSFGPGTAERLHLVPLANHVDSHGVRYSIVDDARASTVDAKRVWVVKRDRYPVTVRLDARFEPAVGVLPMRFGNGELSVQRFEPR